MNVDSILNKLNVVVVLLAIVVILSLIVIMMMFGMMIAYGSSEWLDSVEVCTDMYQQDKPNETRYYQCMNAIEEPAIEN